MRCLSCGLPVLTVDGAIPPFCPNCDTSALIAVPCPECIGLVRTCGQCGGKGTVEIECAPITLEDLDNIGGESLAKSA